MTDFILYAQAFMLVTNIIVFIFIMQEHSLKMKALKVALLIAISLGTLINLGKLTWLNVIFAFTPFLLLGKVFKKKKKEAKHNLA